MGASWWRSTQRGRIGLGAVRPTPFRVGRRATTVQGAHVAEGDTPVSDRSGRAMIDGVATSPSERRARPMADSKTSVLCPPDPLREFVDSVARRMGADSDVAAELARHLVGSNLAGHDSHGVIRVPQYVADTDRGHIVPSARPVVARESPVAALVDAQRGFGQHSTMFALEWAMTCARQHGGAM